MMSRKEKFWLIFSVIMSALVSTSVLWWVILFLLGVL